MNKANKKLGLTNTYTVYMTTWFIGLALALVVLPPLLDQLFGGLSTDWITFIIELIGISFPLGYMFFLASLKRIPVILLFSLCVYFLITILLVTIDFGIGWGANAMWVGSIIQVLAFISFLAYGVLVLLKAKAYIIFSYLMIIVILNVGFVIDSAIVFYPEAYQSVPIYSLISYVVSWVLIQASYRMKQHAILTSVQMADKKKS